MVRAAIIDPDVDALTILGVGNTNNGSQLEFFMSGPYKKICYKFSLAVRRP